MTLIITAINKSAVVQASDRRLTKIFKDGKVKFEDNANKAICVSNRDAKFGIAYTGLAEVRIFDKIIRTDELIINYLAKINAGDKTLREIVKALANYVTPIINKQNVEKNHRRTTLVIAGFFKGRPFVGGISNFEDENGELLPVKDVFEFWIKCLSPTDESPYLFMVNGLEKVVDDTFEPRMNKKGGKIANQSNKGLARELVLLIRWAAHHPTIGKNIGQNCMTTIIPAEGDFITEYHPLKVSPSSYTPHLIQPGIVFKNVQIKRVMSPS